MEKAKEENRLESRYVVTNNTSGEFTINVDIKKSVDFVEDKVVKLQICQECLRAMNWHGFRKYAPGGDNWFCDTAFIDERMKIVRSFDIAEYLEEFKNKRIAARQLPDKGFYHAKVSRRDSESRLRYDTKKILKKAQGCVCESCGRMFNDRLLEIHHKDHNPSNQNTSNLQVLCAVCHNEVHIKEGGYRQQVEDELATMTHDDCEYFYNEKKHIITGIKYKYARKFIMGSYIEEGGQWLKQEDIPKARR